MAARFKAPGFPDADVEVVGPSAKKKNVVARLRGTGAGRPILLLAHLDVVEARREDWSFDPYVFLERDGYFYGRGTNDNKVGRRHAGGELHPARRRKAIAPDRDIIVALTADEEGGTANGVDWLLQNAQDLIDAEFCAQHRRRRRRAARRQEGRQRGADQPRRCTSASISRCGTRVGTARCPVKDNAIYRLAHGLARLAEFDFPVRLERNDAARSSRRRRRSRADAWRPTCARWRGTPDPRGREAAVGMVALLQLADADDLRRDAALRRPRRQRAAPARARDGQLPAASRRSAGTVRRAGAGGGRLGDHVARAAEPTPSPASPLRPDVMAPVEKLVAQMWPGAPSSRRCPPAPPTACTCGNVGIPVYGVAGLFDGSTTCARTAGTSGWRCGRSSTASSSCTGWKRRWPGDGSQDPTHPRG